MSCPPSLNPIYTRGGNSSPPCESELSNSPTTNVQAGDRLKVGWVSNNHGGGYVRISLVHESMKDAESFDRHVLKAACYGHDERPGKFSNGDCVHPCNARGACDYQSDVDDINRYDTTISIPTNLQNGIYFLQWNALVGNGADYYSCARLRISGGNPEQRCDSKYGMPVDPAACLKNAGGLSPSILFDGARYGHFCFTGDSGDVDNDIKAIPINVNCDPRTSCSLSVRSAECEALYDIRDPIDPVTVCESYPIVQRMTFEEESDEYASENTTDEVVTITKTVIVKSGVKTVMVDINGNAVNEIQNGSPCDLDTDQYRCSGDKLARCVWKKWIVQPCPAGTTCVDGYCDHIAL